MDIYQTIQWMQGQLAQYEQRICTLENALCNAENEIKQLKEKPSIQVGTIQYKFDQLKVETLDGTLNIGLNPQDLQGIEDFAVQQGQSATPMMPMEMMHRSINIEEAMNGYIESDLGPIIMSAQEKLGMPQSDAYLSFIQNDIRKQLPSRIEHHLRLADSQGQNEVSPENIVETLKKEIENGVLTFLSNLPNTPKGDAQ